MGAGPRALDVGVQLQASVRNTFSLPVTPPDAFMCWGTNILKGYILVYFRFRLLRVFSYFFVSGIGIVSCLVSSSVYLYHAI